MCEFCSGISDIKKTIPLNKLNDMTLSLRHDSECEELLKLRVELGATGYTLPIKANYCLYCGKKLEYLEETSNTLVTITMSYITINRIFETYEEFIDVLIEKDKQRGIPVTYNTLKHFYNSVTMEIQEHLRNKYPNVCNYLNNTESL